MDIQLIPEAQKEYKNLDRSLRKIEIIEIWE